MKERIAGIISEHWAVLDTGGPHPQALHCAAEGCTWTGTWYTEHAAHQAELILAAVTHAPKLHGHEWVENTRIGDTARTYICTGCDDHRIDDTIYTTLGA